MDNSATKHHRRAHQNNHSGKYLDVSPVSGVIKDRTGDRTSRKAGQRRDKEGKSRAESNLGQGRDLRDQCTDQGNIGSEKKPNSTEKAMVADWPFAGIQSARVSTPAM